jgi:transcriptional regulator with XRE-family HTH domain
MKKKIEINQDEETFFQQFAESIPDETKRFISLSMDISVHINSLIQKNKLNQRTLARNLNKKESEISRWLSGNHNFTLKSLAKLESFLAERIVLVPNELESYDFVTANSVTVNTSESAELNCPIFTINKISNKINKTTSDETYIALSEEPKQLEYA